MNVATCCASPKLKWVALDRSQDKRTVHNHWSNRKCYQVEGRKLGPKINAYVCQSCGKADRITEESIRNDAKAMKAYAKRIGA